MSIEHARSHVIEGFRTGEVNCASAALAAILPFQPSQHSLEMAYYNLGVSSISIIALSELATHGILAHSLQITNHELPSRFLHQIYQELTHEIPYETFFGALIRTKEETGAEGEPIDHVIAVTKLHKNWKATIVDTAPHTLASRSDPLVKKVPLMTLDRRIAQDESETRAVAFISFSGISERRTLTSSQRAYLNAILEENISELETQVDQVSGGWKVHQDILAKHSQLLLNGRTKRRFRLDRRMHETST